nr:RNase H-like domain-containing protein [Nostoc sp. DedSLP05]
MDERMEQVEKKLEEQSTHMKELSIQVQVILDHIEAANQLQNIKDNSTYSVDSSQGGQKGDNKEEEHNTINHFQRNNESQPPIFRYNLQVPNYSHGGDIESDEWLAKLENVIDALRISDAKDQINFAIDHLKGPIYTWATLWKREGKTHNFKHFVEAFKEQTEDNWSDPYDVQMAHCFQKGRSVKQYTEEFEKLHLKSGKNSREALPFYISNLRPEIREDIRRFSPKTLNDAIKMARQTESCNQTQQRRSYQPEHKLAGQGFIRRQPTTPTNSSINETSGVSQQAKEIERAKERTLGICHTCKKPWARGHKCLEKKLYNVEVDIEDEEEEQGPMVEEPNDKELDQVEELIEQDLAQTEELDDGHPTLSLSAMTGIAPPNTIKLSGFLRKEKVIILVDPGSTHNFIDSRIAKKLGLYIEKKEFHISLPGNRVLSCQGEVKHQRLRIADFEFSSNYYTFDIGGFDIVLGVEWLRTLGTYALNHDESFIRFKVEGKKYQLQGINSPKSKVISAEKMRKTLNKGHAGFMAVLFSMQVESKNELPLEQKKEIDEIICHYHDIFQELPGNPPPSRNMEHIIELEPGKGPTIVRPYRYGHKQKTEIERLTQELLDSGAIIPSKSPYAAPVILCRKKDGSFRMCVDYRALNKITLKNKYPIPRMDDIIDELHGAKYFTKIDLRSGYHQIPIRAQDTEKTAFRTHQGLYEFKVMPFGLTNAPATFQANMNHVFAKFLRKFVMVFFDDILIYSRTWEEHLDHIQQVLEVLRSNQFYAKLSKCSFGKETLEYLGHIIGREGLRIDSSKVQAIIDWPIPKNVSKLRGFLGMTGYCRQFIKGYATIAGPLTDLTKKGNFSWNEKAGHSFEELKKCISTAPVLALPDFSQPFIVECDASGTGIGATLLQGKHPIAYESRKLNLRERAKSTYDKEMLAILHALAKWRQYLLGTKFIVKTDHHSLKYFLTQQNLSEEQQRWVSKIQDYDFEIAYTKGKDNVIADALSRKFEDIKCSAMTVIIPTWFDELQQEYLQDNDAREIMNKDPSELIETQWAKKGITLTYKNRIYLPKTSKLKNIVLKEHHESPTAGHSGFQKTYERIKRSFFWKGMKADIKKMVAECDICQRQKAESVQMPGLLQPLNQPEQKWEEISMDFITGLPKSGSKDALWVIIDRLTKYAHFIPVHSSYKTPQLAEIFMENIYRLHGFPKKIISDRDPKFTSHFWKELFKLVGTQLAMSTSYHPQTDGQTEVTNKSVETYLRCYAGDNQSQWIKWIHLAEYWYNTNYHTTIKTTPFRALYGYPPPAPVDYLRGTTKAPVVEELIAQSMKIVEELKQSYNTTRNRMKQQSDQRRTERQFEVGEWVFVKLQPYKQTSLRQRGKYKLAPRFYGPFKIRKKIGEVAYALELPSNSKIHDVFHVSNLKKKIGYHTGVATELPVTNEEGKMIVEPEGIIEVRQRKLRSRDITEYLVKWKGLPHQEATWEDKQFLQDHPSLLML